MVNQSQVKNKRSFYNILQVSEDADIDAIAASYRRLKSKYESAVDTTTRNELLFIEHAFDTLSDSNKRNLYDKQLTNAPISSTTQYHYDDGPSNGSMFTNSKIVAVMIGVLIIIAYGLNTRHSEEKGKISVSKEAVVGNNEASRINAESNYILSNGTVENVNKSINRSADIAEKALDIKRQEAETRRMEAESRIKVNEAAITQRNDSQKAAEEKIERCQYMRSLVNQANRAGAYEEARALQARGC